MTVTGNWFSICPLFSFDPSLAYGIYIEGWMDYSTSRC